MSDEVIIRKVKSLLNKLTLEKFDSISDQIWEYAKQSEKETDGRALKVVIQLTFDKACDEPPFAVMWAQLCRKMYDTITDEIKDVNVKDKEGNTVSGVNLLRKYLLNRCQHDFERGWKMQIPEVDQNNPDMMSDEYYAAVKAKRQGLGLVVFIGELFKRQMLTDRIMLQCLTRLCDNPREVGDEETETMCKLITTIGKSLDTSSRRNKEWMDTYFERMKEMMESPHLSSRVKFMILDLFDLRKNKWVSRRGNQPAPTTIAQVHEQAQKAKNEEKEAMKRTSSSRGSLPHPMSRAGSHRGAGSRDLQREGSTGSNAASTTVDGWSTVGSGSPGSSSKGTRANELANFGKTDRSKTRSSVLGPGNSPFASLHRASSKAGGDQKSSPSESRSSSANMFR
ncbi:armadillo-type protein [Phascolomyces articulosus]|uniref:Armadillo-type protein n=1 Tax=Phascolomyces articulosus TaxID=60185 RepID=A0AAD5JMD1_9FUNG|nr:armadillo-type protein [Phascolomyces articulosus]